jgi:hypothetical protein
MWDTSPENKPAAQKRGKKKHQKKIVKRGVKIDGLPEIKNARK